MSDLKWDDFDLDNEDVSESDAKNIETGDSVPIGRYKSTVIDAQPKRIDFKLYSCVGLKLKFEVNQVLEVNGKIPEGDEFEHLEGKHYYDDVAFQHESEKAGMAKRRKLVALRLGLIHPGGTLTKSVWQNIVGKEIINRLVENKYEDKKTGEEKTGFPQVGFFDGYERADKSGEVATEETWKDI